MTGRTLPGKPGRCGVIASLSAMAGALLGGSAMAQDECTSPIPMLGVGVFFVDTTGYTTSFEQPGVCEFNRQIQNDAWVCWTAPETGAATVSTAFSAFDTVIAAYAGCACPTGAAMVCNDDFGSLQSRITFDVVGGETYLLQIGTFSSGVSGEIFFELTLDPAGACCFSDGSCAQLASASCLSQGGFFNGAGVDCGSVVCEDLFADDMPIALNCNWNGIVHGTAEQGNPDNPDGYRSIADRALHFADGTPFTLGAAGFRYQFVETAFTNDLVYLGNRNVVGIGCNCPFDAVADFDNIGTQPNWLTDPFVTSVTTNVMPALSMTANTRIAVLYNYTNGGGFFDMTLGFADASSVTLTLQGPDWFANNNGVADFPGFGVDSQAVLAGPLSGGDGFPGTQDHDMGNPGAPLNLVEAVVTRDRIMFDFGIDIAGRSLTAITFDNRTSDRGNVAIYAVTADGAEGGSVCGCEFDGSAGVDVFDLLAYLDLWFASAPAANIDTVPGVDVFDLLFFLDCWFPASAGAPCP